MARLFLLLYLCSVGAAAAALDFVTELGNIYPTKVAAGGDGSIWVAGYLYQGGPLRTTPDAFQPRPPEVRCQIGRLPCPIGFLAQLDGKGRLLYSTYMGGGNTPVYEPIRGLTADAEGHAFVSGFASVGRPFEGGGSYTMKLSPEGGRVQWLANHGALELLTVAPDGGVIGLDVGADTTPLLGSPDTTPLLRYESEDGWIPVGDRLPEGALRSAAISGDGTLVARVGAQVFWSSDFGDSWRPSANPLPEIDDRAPIVLALHPHDSTVALIASTQGRVFRTEDGGASWTASTGLPDDVEIHEVLIADGRSGRAYATGFHYVEGYRYPLYFRSSDGGASWTPMENPESAGIPRISYLPAMTADPRSPDTLFATAVFPTPSDQPGHTVLRTDDAGQTWLLLRSGLRQADAILVDPLDSDVVYLTTAGGIEVSRDRGRTWRLAVPLDLNGSTPLLASEQVGGAVFASTRWGVYRSDDQGRTWRLLEAQPPGEFRYLLAALGDASGGVRLLGFAANGSYSSRNAVTKILADGSGVEWSFAVGGSGPDWISGFAAEPDGAIWLTGHTRSVDFPVAGTGRSPYPGGEYSAFLAKLDPVRAQLEFSTVFGGTANDAADAIFVDDSGEILIFGTTSSPDFPFTNAWTDGPADQSRRFLARFDPTTRRFISIEPSRMPEGQILRASQGRFISVGSSIIRADADDLSGPSVQLQGGQVQSAALDPEGRIILAVTAQTAEFGIVGDPRKKRILEQTAVVTALDFDRESGAPKITGVENGAGFFDGPIAPGEILTLRGRWLASEPHIFQAGEGGAISAELSGVRVSFDGLPGAPLFVSPNQINVVAPYALEVGATAQIQVVTQLGQSVPVDRPVAEAAPALFTQNGTGTGPVVALDADLREISVENPAERGVAVALFATGLGRLDGELPVDRIVPSVLPLPAPTLPVQIEIGGILVEPEWIGASPTRPAGVVQVNVRIPSDLPPGSDVPIRLLAGGEPTQPGTSIFVD